MSTLRFLNEDILVDPAKDRQFGGVMAVAFLLVGGWPLWQQGVPRWWALGLAVGLALVAVGRPHLLHGGHGWWLCLGALLHRVMNPLIMGVFFFGIITPMGLVKRLFHPDPLHLRFDPAATTYWQPKQPAGPRPETMGQQF